MAPSSWRGAFPAPSASSLGSAATEHLGLLVLVFVGLLVVLLTVGVVDPMRWYEGKTQGAGSARLPRSAGSLPASDLETMAEPVSSSDAERDRERA